MELYDYLKGHPNIISIDFKHVGITDALALLIKYFTRVYIPLFNN